MPLQYLSKCGSICLMCVCVCVCRPGMRSTPGPFSRWEKKNMHAGEGGGWSMPQHWVNFLRYTCSRIYRTHKMTSGLTNLNIWSIIFSTQSSVDITQKVTSVRVLSSRDLIFVKTYNSIKSKCLKVHMLIVLLVINVSYHLCTRRVFQ